MGAPCQGGFTSRSEFGCSRLFFRSRQQDERPVNLTATPDNSDNATANDDNDDRSG
jgi:hypothetical protein